MAEPHQHPTSNLPKYFNKLSQIYPRQTGNSTKNLFAQIKDQLAPITSSSHIHDNASGPGTATEVILKTVLPDIRPKIVATDMVPAMIEALDAEVSEQDWGNNVATAVMNSQKLDLPDDSFTHSITNMSVFNFSDPLRGIKEIHRTLQPRGQAVITTWKRFGIGEVIHEVQRRIRPDLPLMKYSGEEMHSADAVMDLMLTAGFGKKPIKVLQKSQIVAGEDLEGLSDFARGPFTEPARKDWTDEEQAKWKSVLDQVLDEEKEKHGGVKFEMWAVFATK